MDEVVLRRVVGVITLAIAAFLLSWLLPRPGLDRLRGEGERVMTVDLTRPDSRPQEVLPPSAEEAAAVEPQPAPTAEPVPAPEPAVAENSKPAEPAHAVEPPKPAAAIVSAKPAEPKPVEPKAAESPKPAPPKPAEPKPAKPAAEAPPVASSGGGSGKVMVQAGAYSFLDKAEGVRARAGAQGQHCVISPAETSKGTLYRLRCGPYADGAAAQAAVKTLTAAGIAAQVVGAGR
jgi:DedD protein